MATYHIQQQDVPDFKLVVTSDKDPKKVITELAFSLRRAFYFDDTPIDGDKENTIRESLRGPIGGMICWTLEHHWSVYFDADDKVVIDEQPCECELPIEIMDLLAECAYAVRGGPEDRCRKLYDRIVGVIGNHPLLDVDSQ